MKIIGVTGKSGSGKTTFAENLAKKLNCKHIDIDKISHMPLQKQEVIHILCEKFGDEILNENGKIDRKKLGVIVFSEGEKMDELVKVTEADAYQELDNIISMENNSLIVLEWIKLPSSQYWQKCDIKILVKADDIKRKERVMKRDKISEEYFKKRDSASIEYKEAEFSYIFVNDYNEPKMEETINTISSKIMEENAL